MLGAVNNVTRYSYAASGLGGKIVKEAVAQRLKPGSDKVETAGRGGKGSKGVTTTSKARALKKK